eukprot:GHVR01050885.1.p1 GENE.GHVR01050885.1~~GHVR01050885.1.p1  ORF type:complete len:218 (-),score=15.45 GHVR01050885.1:497-1150(-)
MLFSVSHETQPKNTVRTQHQHNTRCIKKIIKQQLSPVVDSLFGTSVPPVNTFEDPGICGKHSLVHGALMFCNATQLQKIEQELQTINFKTIDLMPTPVSPGTSDSVVKVISDFYGINFNALGRGNSLVTFLDTLLGNTTVEAIPSWSFSWGSQLNMDYNENVSLERFFTVEGIFEYLWELFYTDYYTQNGRFVNVEVVEDSSILPQEWKNRRFSPCV